MKLIVGNWKMYPKTLAKAKRIVVAVKKNTGHTRVKVVICPPTVYIAPLIELTKNISIAVGAQNAFVFEEGAYTGETSPRSLKNLGVTHVILGHSERRMLGEDDALIAKKVVLAVRNKLKVVLCVGEKIRDEHGSYFTEVSNQLRASLEGFPKSGIKYLIVAYEPVWAIGTKALHAAKPEDFREMSVFIKRNLVDRFGKNIGRDVPILYGGSVDERNVDGFLKAGGADGFLVGRASLDPQKFSAIIHCAEQIG